LPAHKTRTLFKTLSSPGGAGYNELRIEDKAGQEQIYVHAQRNWDENIENDQLVRVGNERHDTVESNSYSEFKTEEHRTTIGDRKSYITVDDHLSVGATQHVKLGESMLVEVGNEIHLKAGNKVVIDAGMELTLLAAGSFVKLDASGVTMVGPLVQANVGGSAGNGSGIAIKLPQLPREVDADQVGHLMAEAMVNAPVEHVKSQPLRMLNFSG
jgi:type VI secretion system secreted protein VgrG